MLDVYSMLPNPSTRKIIRRDEVLEMTGLSKTALYNLIDKGEFPRQVRLGSRAVGWYEDEVQEWIRRRDQSRIAPEARDLRQETVSEGPTDRATPGFRKATSSSTRTSSQPARTRVRNSENKDLKPSAGSKGAAPSSNLERIGTTSDGREMLRDPSTGNLLLVIGHMPADWAS